MKIGNQLDIIKGIHPGFVLERELKKRNLSKGRFAISINEFPQTIGAITKGKRGMNTALSLRIERELGLEEGYFMVLQVFYDIEVEKSKQQKILELPAPKLRPILFWDTEPEKIDWQKQKKAVIQRVFERGNADEKDEIIRYYGKDKVEEILSNMNSKRLDNYNH
ncbi:MAG: plasmid maintenance system antidote protein [Bacteroidetes bacterium]|nr:plasmid maintenance system antidote protein [Bacteroidota bacterium]